MLHRVPVGKEAKSAKKGPAVSPRVNLPTSNRDHYEEQQKTDRKKVKVMNEDSESCGEDEAESDENENQFAIIYPNERNKEEDYLPFLEHAQKLYEQFTGSYSKKKPEAA